MPKRTDISTILIIGSGPIVIGQACEFDYSGTQACKALQEEGYRIVLVNSNPATIMTDPQFSDRTYIEPITPEVVARIIEQEHDGEYHVDALLPTLGGQTALNTACKLYDDGVLDRFGIEMIGANRQVIYRAEDREQFCKTVESVGLQGPRGGIAHSIPEALEVLEGSAGSGVGLPAIVRPAFTLGGTGGGVAYNREEFEDIVRRGLDASMTRQVLIDQSVIGWKEYELEVMRDRDDNTVIICSIENFDPMGVHTGDSITVAPAQTLTDKEYQRLRDASLAIIRAVGVETGGSNIQFAVNPADGQMLVIEMNPRVSRSSALASKATGFPIAKIAAKLAVGYTLWELPNDITGKTVACFEPTIDYVVTKIPRWTFEKFPDADETLTTQMKSVGEAMSIGRTFKESLQKGIRSMEVKRYGLGMDGSDVWLTTLRATCRRLERDHGPTLQAAARIAGGASLLKATALLQQDPTCMAELDSKARSQMTKLSGELAATDGSSMRDGGSDAIDSPPQEIENAWPISADKLNRKLNVPSQGRIYYVRYAFRCGWSIEQVHAATGIDPWFLDQIKQLVDFEQVLIAYERLEDMPTEVLFQAKQLGYSDAQLANLYRGQITMEDVLHVRRHRQQLKIATIYKLVDTCAAEFEAATPYYYSTYEAPVLISQSSDSDPQAVPGQLQKRFDDEIRVSDKPKIVILGGGPNRIGQGIEFDYCCVQAAYASKELGYEAVMINSNPETVSTDYDTSDLLFFEPLTLEDVLNICEKLNGKPLVPKGTSEANRAKVSSSPGRLHGVIVQFGGQTPLNLAHGLESAGVPIIGTSVDSIDLAEDRDRFKKLLAELDLRQPDNGIANSLEEAVAIANRIGYPVLVRPSYVLGGRGMETCFNETQLIFFMKTAVNVSDLNDAPVLIDKFLAEATEVDVDVVADYGPALGASNGSPHPDATCLICGVMEHIEEAGIHSGDSACTIPPHSLPVPVVEALKDQSRRLAAALQVRGLMNIQFAIRNPNDNFEIYVIEVNPRASRTVPFVSKATGISWARIAAKVMAGASLVQLGIRAEVTPSHTSVKESVFPFNMFPGVDVILGPEMRSTGEVMGIDPGFPIAFAKAQMAANNFLPTEGKVFLSVREGDKPLIVSVARQLVDMDFDLLTTTGTHAYLASHGLPSAQVKKISEGRPNCEDLIKNHDLALIINTPTRKGINSDEGCLRAMAVRFNVPMITTVTGATAAVCAIAALRDGAWSVKALQDYHRQPVATSE